MHRGSFEPSVAAVCRTSMALKRALDELGAHAGQLLVHRQKAWASATFKGTRQRLTYAFDREGAIEHGEALIARLPDHEFTIPGQMVADATVTAVEHTLRPAPRLVVDLELLLLEES